MKQVTVKIPIPITIQAEFQMDTGHALPEELDLGIELYEEGSIFIYRINKNLVIRNNIITLDNGYVTEDSLKRVGNGNR